MTRRNAHAALAGQRMVVVGGSTGIGRGVADAWAAAGAEVWVTSRRPPVGAGADALRWRALDLTDRAAARGVLAELTHGRLDGACYSAVHYGDRRANLRDVTEAEWLRQLDVNLHGLWLTVHAALPALGRAEPGLLLGISSEVVYNAGPGRSGYAATKAAAASLLQSVAQEERGERVRVVQALPEGMVDSPGIRRRRPNDFDFGDYMRPESFAPLALELALTRGADFDGDSLVVGADGRWRPAAEDLPESQSRTLIA